MRPRTKIVIATAAWLLAVIAGNAWLLFYSLQPGQAATGPTTWPASSALERTDGASTLIMFAHPRCPCTHASVSELARLLTRAPPQLRTYVVFLQPEGVEPGWERTELRARAATIPGVTVLDDHDGAEAARFAVSTSGTTLFFDAAGVLRFSGGITAARGHEGPSVGQDRIIALLTSGASDRNTSDVYGCALTPSSAIVATANP